MLRPLKDTSKPFFLENKRVTLYREDNSDGQQTQLEIIEQIKKEKGRSYSFAFDSNPTVTSLFNHLFTESEHYKYELVLDNDIPSPIFRERNLV